MCHWNYELGGSERASSGRVGFVVDEYHRRHFGNQDLSDAAQQSTRHGIVAKSVHLELVPRLCHLELVEEEVRYVRIEMLASVHEHPVQTGSARLTGATLMN